jgi:hypothetical protein
LFLTTSKIAEAYVYEVILGGEGELFPDMRTSCGSRGQLSKRQGTQNSTRRKKWEVKKFIMIFGVLGLSQWISGHCD